MHAGSAGAAGYKVACTTYRFVHGQRDAIQRTQVVEAGANEAAQLLAFTLAALAVSVAAVVLHTNPQAVHFRKVGDEEADGVVHRATHAIIRCACIRQLVLALLDEVVAQEEAALRVLHTLHHAQNVSKGGARARREGTDHQAAHCNHQIPAQMSTVAYKRAKTANVLMKTGSATKTHEQSRV